MEGLLNHCAEQVANFTAKSNKQAQIARNWRSHHKRGETDEELVARYKSDRAARVAAIWAARELDMREAMALGERWGALATLIGALPPSNKHVKSIQRLMESGVPILRSTG